MRIKILRNIGRTLSVSAGIPMFTENQIVDSDNLADKLSDDLAQKMIDAKLAVLAPVEADLSVPKKIK